MSRGWDSKFVESQIEDAQSRRPAGAKAPVDPAELERRRERGSLELARERVLHDLAATHNFRMEQMLRASLRHLDQKIAELS